MASYRINQHEDYLEIILEGDITIGCSLSFKEEIKKAIAEHNCYTILLDLENVSFMDSSGLGMLISLFKDINEHSGSIVFYNVQDYVRKLIKLVRLDQVFTVADTKDEAYEKLKKSL